MKANKIVKVKKVILNFFDFFGKDEKNFFNNDIILVLNPYFKWSYISIFYSS